MSDSEMRHITIHPVISYPHEAEVGKTYLMSIDIQTEYDAETWPYEREDFALHCILDTKPLFNHKAFGEPVIVLNRFGGTYGPASFLLTATTSPQQGAVTVTLINEQGLPIHQVTLPDINIVWETKKSVKFASSETEIPVPTPPEEPLHNLPVRTQFFTGREEDLLNLQRQLTSTEEAVSLWSVVGLGGVGKSQLVLEYAYRNLEDYDFVWWLKADNLQNLLTGYLELGRALSLASSSGDLTEQAKIVLDWLRQTENHWLLIFDDADLTPLEITNYVPSSGDGHILITSRNPVWSSDFRGATLDVFTPKEAVEFLRARLPRKCLNIPDDLLTPVIKELKLKEASEENEETESALEELEAERLDLLAQDAISIFLDRLVVELDCLPLALEMAAAYMEARQVDIVTYLQLFQTHRQEISSETEATDTLSSTLNAIWQITFEQLNEIDGATQLLFLCSFLASENLPLDTFRKLDPSQIDTTLISVLTDEATWNGALNALTQTSVCVRNGDVISIHRLVQAVSRDRLKFQEAARWVQICADLLNAIYDLDVYDLRTWGTAGRLLPHLSAVTDWAEQYNVDGEAVSSLNNTIGLYLRIVVGDYAGARLYYERALATAEKTLGTDHPLTAITLNNLGALLFALGDYAAARPYLERALAIRENALGPDHPDTAASLNNLGAIYREMGDFAVARPYYERALTINEKTLGPDHPDTALSLNNLGAVLDSMGDLAAARPFYERALAIREKTLGPDHPDTALSLNNLGSLLQAMGNLAAARPFYERALAINEKALGPDHPDTSFSLNNLGYLLQAMGDLAAARPFYERALAIREKTLGPDHPDTARSLNNLGGLLRAMGDLAAARPFYERALAIREKALGPHHPDTARSLNNLGGLLNSMGEYQRARPYYERALAIDENALGPDHPNTATDLNNLGALLDSMGNYEAAQSYYKRALAIREKALGPTHPDTASSLNNLGSLLQAMGDLAGARQYYKRALTIYENVLGPAHPHTKTVRANVTRIESKVNTSPSDEEVISGDTVSGSKIYVGDIAGSQGVAIGSGASVNVEQSFPLTKLRKLLVSHFNLAELRSLCFQLNIDYDGLSGSTLNDKSLELVSYCQRRGRVSELIETCRKERPNIMWE